MEGLSHGVEENSLQVTQFRRRHVDKLLRLEELQTKAVGALHHDLRVMRCTIAHIEQNHGLRHDLMRMRGDTRAGCGDIKDAAIENMRASVPDDLSANQNVLANRFAQFGS